MSSQRQPINILLIEDTMSDAELVCAWLEEATTENFHISHVPDIETSVDLLAKRKFDIVMLDLSLPDATDLEGLAHVQNMAPTVPVIILTGRADEKLALAAVEEGAQDYLVKDEVDNVALQRSIRYAIQRKRFEDRMIHQANFDRLTDLANGMLFESRLNLALARKERSGKGIALFYLDLNGFKQINDRFGHAMGDSILKEIGRRIPLCIRPYDTAARLGGDEFAILVEGMSEIGDCARVAQKLIDRMTQPIVFDAQEVRVGVSIGIATCIGKEKCTAERLQASADKAMYRVKSDNSASHYLFYTEDMDETWGNAVHLPRGIDESDAAVELYPASVAGNF